MTDARKKFSADVAWNVGSLAVLGVSGILLNVLIGRCYDEAALGVFNQALAAYIFFSQLAVGVTMTTINRHLEAAGIPRRARGSSGRRRPRSPARTVDRDARARPHRPSPQGRSPGRPCRPARRGTGPELQCVACRTTLPRMHLTVQSLRQQGRRVDIDEGRLVPWV